MSPFHTRCLASGFSALAIAIGARSNPDEVNPGGKNLATLGEAGGSRLRATPEVPPPLLPTKSRIRSTPDRVRITIGGQVRSPGPVRLTTASTLWTAIQHAGGATEFGSLRRVHLIRGRKRVDHDLTTEEGMLAPVQDGDTVVVPQKTFFGL